MRTRRAWRAPCSAQGCRWPSAAPERPALAISGYVIDAELDPATHHLAAKAVVTFTAPETAEWSASAFIRR
jgi:hypothetical protein